MKQIQKITLYIITVVLIIFYACNNENQAGKDNIKYETTGPDSGSLVIVGGAMKDSAIINRFISLAGGVDSPIIVIPTASGDKEIDVEKTKQILTSAGARNVTVLHTYDTVVANSDTFILPLKKARGVWFNGGRQWRLVDAYSKYPY
jgi:cyanophycinase